LFPWLKKIFLLREKSFLCYGPKNPPGKGLLWNHKSGLKQRSRELPRRQLAFLSSTAGVQLIIPFRLGMAGVHLSPGKENVLFLVVLHRSSEPLINRKQEQGEIVEDAQVKRLQFGTLKVEIHPSAKAAGLEAARAAAKAIAKLAQTREAVGVIFATGASQLAILDALTSLPDVPWSKVRGLHMDEYIGISAQHPASFRRYLRERLTTKVRMKEFFEIDGEAPDAEETCREYAGKVQSSDPELCLLGVGENGHLAFNDPAVADFRDSSDVKIVRLDQVCRNQQVKEGWFTTMEQVPECAITLTIPTLLRVPQLIVSVPGRRKAKIVRATLDGPLSTDCPATILRTHPNVTMYLDRESADEIDEVLAVQNVDAQD
jgi:glucosamine-6-phosphate deaminase